jgi:ubiquinone biosynthesis protein
MIRRSFQLALAALRLLLAYLRERAARVPAERSGLPRRLRLELERLGPSFVKAGQALSLRQDLLPERYLVELERLQADVAPFPAAQARLEIARALGRDVGALFATFDDRPIAAASIAQVHAARLSDGREVIVKVRRPGIRRRIDRDMRALVRLLGLLSALSPKLARLRPKALADEIWANLRRETDFNLEARSMRRFARAFEHDSRIEVPAVIDGLVAENVLVQERKDGHLLGDSWLGQRGPELSGLLVEVYLRQIFVLGFFHGDPHPGNLFFTAAGAVCFHDFGLVGQLDRRTRGEVAMFIQAFIHQDAGWMLDAAMALGLLAPGEARGSFLRGIEDLLADYSALPLSQWSLADMLLRVSRLGPPGSVQIPYNLLVLMRAMFLLESALRRLDPSMNMLEMLARQGSAAFPSLAEARSSPGVERLQYEAALAAQLLPGSVASALGRMRRSGFRAGLSLGLPDVERMRVGLERAGNRLALSIVILGLFVGSSLLMQHSIGPRLFGVPVLAGLGYVLALWYALRLARGVARSGHL